MCKGIEVKISAFADDTQLYIADEASLKETWKILKAYSAASGAKINEDKTKCILLGAMKNKGISKEKITCVKSVKALGIQQGTEVSIEKYWNNILDKAKLRIDKWKMRQLTLYGKILVFRSLIFSMFAYGAAYQIVPDFVMEKLNTMMWSFICNGKTESVQRNICMQQPQDGGMGCIDVINMINVNIA